MIAPNGAFSVLPAGGDTRCSSGVSSAGGGPAAPSVEDAFTV